MNKEDEISLARELGKLTEAVKGAVKKLDTMETELKDTSTIIGEMAKIVAANSKSLGYLWKLVLLLLSGMIAVSGYLFTR